MQKNYIILAHKNPEQLKCLVDKLSDGESNFFIHIDKNMDINPFKHLLSNNSVVQFIEQREEGTWGDLGIVKATLNGLREAINANNQGYCILLSGQDYPIKNNEDINLYLNQHKGIDFIDISTIQEAWPNKFKERINFYRYNLSHNKGQYILVPPVLSSEFYTLLFFKNIFKLLRYPKKAILNLSFIKNLFKIRVPPINIVQFAGSQWWAFSYNTAKKVLDFINKEDDFLDYHKYTHLPDEIIFQSVIKYLSNKDPSIQYKNSLTFVKWPEKPSKSPIIWKKSDFEELLSQPENKLFARKFDSEMDDKILILIDKYI